MVEFAILTNNNLLNLQNPQIEYHQTDSLHLLEIAGRHIQKGRLLLTHPLSQSIKPWQSSAKSLFLSRDYGETVDFESSRILTAAITKFASFSRPTDQEYHRYKNDMEETDAYLAREVLAYFGITDLHIKDFFMINV